MTNSFSIKGNASMKQEITTQVIGSLLILNQVCKEKYNRTMWDCTDEELAACQDRLTEMLNQPSE